MAIIHSYIIDIRLFLLSPETTSSIIILFPISDRVPRGSNCGNYTCMKHPKTKTHIKNVSCMWPQQQQTLLGTTQRKFSLLAIAKLESSLYCTERGCNFGQRETFRRTTYGGSIVMIIVKLFNGGACYLSHIYKTCCMYSSRLVIVIENLPVMVSCDLRKFAELVCRVSVSRSSFN